MNSFVLTVNWDFYASDNIKFVGFLFYNSMLLNFTHGNQFSKS